MAYPRFTRSRQMVKARRTSGSITLNSTVWADVDTGLDLTLKEVQVGDEIYFGLGASLSNEAVFAYFNVVTVVGGVVTNGFAERGAATAFGTGAGETEGLQSWFSPTGVHWGLSGDTPPYTVVADDLTDGAITLRLRYATNAATNRTLRASATNPLDVWAMNIGPVQAA